MRLNLPNYHCRQFGLESEFGVSATNYAGIDQLMDLTSTHSHEPDAEDPEGIRVAFFGSRFTVGGTRYQSLANLSGAPRGDAVNVELRIVTNRAPSSSQRRPERIKPVNVLVDAASPLFGPIDVRCDALFEYEPSSGYRSGLRLPIPILAPVESGGVTHIENAEFSRRNDAGLEYRIVVLNSVTSELLVHSVHFESTIELSRSSIRRLLDDARLISNRLLAPTGDY